MANSVDPGQTPHTAASGLGLHCLQRPICPDTWDYYGKSALGNVEMSKVANYITVHQ